MKLLFSDIHASKRAAKDIMRLSKCFTEIICCGDICGYGRYYKYCIDMFQDLNIKSVLGNHDYLVIRKDIDLRDYPREVMVPIERTRRTIKKKELDYLRSLPESLVVDNVFITHTYKLDYYIHTEEDCKKLFELTNLPMIAIGHTHQQADMNVDGVRIINPGSMAKGRSGTPRGYAVMGDDNNVRFVKIKEIIK